MAEGQDPAPTDRAKTGKAARPAGNSGPGSPADPQDQVNLASQSVAGEEDPGASLDMSGISRTSAENLYSGPVSRPREAANPGDEAPAGSPGTGENICRECGGSGRVGDAPCASCNGSGKVVVGLGGG
ncbi:hypothetical protein BH10PSE16_BH10PSE16_29720 [soil metagenome]